MALSPYTLVIGTKSDSLTGYNVIPNANYEIKHRNTNGSSGTLANIFEDPEGNTPITQTGATVNSRGSVTFYADAIPLNAEYNNGVPIVQPIDVGITAANLAAKNLYPIRTLAEATASTDFIAGDYVDISDRGMGRFKWVAGTAGTNPYNPIAHDTLNFSISLISQGVSDAKQFGAGGGGDDTGAFQAAVDANGKFHIPKGDYSISTVNVTSDLIVTSDGGSISPLDNVKLFNIIGVDFSIDGVIFELGVIYTLSDMIALYAFESEKITITNCEFYDGGYQTRIEFCKNIVIERNILRRSSLWPIYIESGEDVIVSGNISTDSTYDGIKVGGFTTSQTSDNDKIIITDNICENNTRDGIDCAVNNAQSIVVTGNICYENLLKGIDIKTITNDGTPQLFTGCLIANNEVIQRINNEESGISLQNNLPATATLQNTLVTANNLISTIGVTSRPAIKVTNCISSVVSNNNITGYLIGITLEGNSGSADCFGNTIKGCGKAFFLAGLDVLAVPYKPDNCRIHNNTQIAGTEEFAFVLYGDKTRIYDNYMDLPQIGVYSIKSENEGHNNASNTTWWDNIRGISSVPPNNWQLIVGDKFVFPEPELGQPRFWVANTSSTGSGATDTSGIDQVGFRTVAVNPIGNTVAQYIGEKIFSSTEDRFYTSFSSGSANWR